MIDLSFLKEYWWAGLILLVIIILAIVLRKRKSKSKPTGENQKHDWQPMGHTVVKDKLRLVFYDKENGVAVHAPIYTIKQLDEIERGLE